MTRRPRGFTLLEQLVAASLLVLVLVMSWQVVRPSLQVWEVNQARADIEQTAVVLQHRMIRELMHSSRDSVTTRASDPPAVSFLSFDDDSSSAYDSSTGDPIWRKFVVYYLDTDNKILYRKEYVSSDLPTTEPFKLTDAQLEAVCTTENGTETRIAWYVLGLTLIAPDEGPVTLNLQLATESPAGMELAEREVDVKMRN